MQPCADQISAYRRDGFLFPFEALTEDEARAHRRALEDAEAQSRATPGKAPAFTAHTNFVLPSVDALTRLPSVIDPVSAILGDDLIVFGCSLFIKEPGTDDFVSWHQDLNYWGLNEDDEVTAWIALSPATVESGCMRFLPGSHRRILPHEDTFAAGNMLSRGQRITETIDESQTVDVRLGAGQMSLHHGRTLHASHPNRSSDRRIGVAVRYVTPEMRQIGGERTIATLVRGRDRFGHFELFDGPRGVLHPSDLAVQSRAVEIENEIMYRGAARKPATPGAVPS